MFMRVVMISQLRWILCVAMGLAASGCATSLRSGSECAVEPGALSDRGALAWHPANAIELHDQTGFVDSSVLSQLRREVADVLEAKGLQLREPGGGAQETDLTLKLVFHVRRELTSVVHEGSPCQGTDCWERVDLGSATRFDVHTTGFLAADVYDGTRPVWRGWVERRLHPEDRRRTDQVLREAVPVLFARFPP